MSLQHLLRLNVSSPIYRETANAEFLEHGQVIKNGNALKLKLTPVGLKRMPKDNAKAKVRLQS